MSDEEEQRPSMAAPAVQPPLVWAAVLAGLTLGAAAAGTCLGLLLGAEPAKQPPAAAGPAGKAGEIKYGTETLVRELPPIIANLAEPSDSWVRVQASIVFDMKTVPKPDLLAAEIAQDLLGFLRTLSLAQIGGASGLQHLREDLNERASTRSGGLVRELIVQTLVVQ
ncbi:MAG TPA: flagellar basal body-associated FliL family protein [Methylocella sp.]